MDRNQTIGIVLIAALVLGYFTFFAPDPPKPVEEEATKSEQTSSDSTQKVATTAKPDTTKVRDSNQVESTVIASSPQTEEKEIVLSNSDIKVTLSSKGGRIKSVELLGYKTYKGDNILLIDQDNSKIEQKLGDIDFASVELDYSTKSKTSTASKSSPATAEFVATVDGKQITQSYSLPEKGFLIDYNAAFTGSDAKSVRFSWKDKLKTVEDDNTYSRQKSWINYYTTEGSIDEFEGSADREEQDVAIEGSLKWFSMKQRFFNAGLISNSSLTNMKVNGAFNELDSSTVKILWASVDIPTANKGIAYQMYFGPNDYSICETVTEGYELNVYYGWVLFRPINKYFVQVIFHLLENVISSYGIIILILVLIVKLILFPIAYRSYLSMAKMKELKPEIDKIKEKTDGDQQATQMATMELYRTVGVNPVSGCIPMVLQMPVLLALFNFFPNAIELRQEAFLWAHDLSTYDNVINWSTSLPFIGNHISIFTLLMTLSTLAYTYYNNQINSAAQGPMKMVGYFMPVIFFFVLNSFSSGLTFYYFVSNLITISQQLLATRFIDKDKIRVQLEENRKKNASGEGKKKSAFKTRLEEAMKAKEEQRKQNKNK